MLIGQVLHHFVVFVDFELVCHAFLLLLPSACSSLGKMLDQTLSTSSHIFVCRGIFGSSYSLLGVVVAPESPKWDFLPTGQGFGHSVVIYIGISFVKCVLFVVVNCCLVLSKYIWSLAVVTFPKIPVLSVVYQIRLFNERKTIDSPSLCMLDGHLLSLQRIRVTRVILYKLRSLILT